MLTLYSFRLSGGNIFVLYIQPNEQHNTREELLYCVVIVLYCKWLPSSLTVTTFSPCLIGQQGDTAWTARAGIKVAEINSGVSK